MRRKLLKQPQNLLLSQRCEQPLFLLPHPFSIIHPLPLQKLTPILNQPYLHLVRIRLLIPVLLLVLQVKQVVQVTVNFLPHLLVVPQWPTQLCYYLSVNALRPLNVTRVKTVKNPLYEPLNVQKLIFELVSALEVVYHIERLQLLSRQGSQVQKVSPFGQLVRFFVFLNQLMMLLTQCPHRDYLLPYRPQDQPHQLHVMLLCHLL